MVGQLLLVNPRRRRRRVRRMSALQRRYFGKRRRSRRRASGGSTIVVANPRRRRRRARASYRRRSHRRIHVRRNPIRRRRHRYSRRRTYRMRRNPIGGSVRGFSMGDAVLGGAIGAGAAFGINAIFGQLSNMLPQSMQPGSTFYPFVKAGAALLVGYGLGSIVNKKYAQYAAAGALTLVIYNNLAPTISQSMNVQLGGMNRYVRMRGMNRYIRGMGRRRIMRLRGLARVRRQRLRGLGYGPMRNRALAGRGIGYPGIARQMGPGTISRFMHG